MEKLRVQWWRIRNALRWSFIKGAFQTALAQAASQLFGLIAFTGTLSIRVFRADGSIEDYGVVSRRVVTNAFVNLLVDDLQASQAAFHSFKYHGMGTDSTAEAATDTALVTEVETRGTGTQTEGASANIYRSVGSVSATASRAIREHGLFTAASGGTLMDRSVFSVINLNTGDSIQFTYELTCQAGG